MVGKEYSYKKECSMIRSTSGAECWTDCSSCRTHWNILGEISSKRERDRKFQSLCNCVIEFFKMHVLVTIKKNAVYSLQQHMY